MKQSRIARSNAPDCLLRTKFFSYHVHSIEFNNTRFRSIYNHVDIAVDNLCKAEICQKNSSHVFKIIAGLDFLNEPRLHWINRLTEIQAMISQTDRLGLSLLRIGQLCWEFKRRGLYFYLGCLVISQLWLWEAIITQFFLFSFFFSLYDQTAVNLVWKLWGNNICREIGSENRVLCILTECERAKLALTQRKSYTTIGNVTPFRPVVPRRNTLSKKTLHNICHSHLYIHHK